MELASIEARVIIALAVRRYGFTKVSMGKITLDENPRPSLDAKMTEEQYQVNFDAAVVAYCLYNSCIIFSSFFSFSIVQPLLD